MAKHRAESFAGGSLVPRSSSFLQSLGFAIHGIFFAFRSEPNLRLHFLATAVLAFAALWFGITRQEAVLLTLACVMVIGAEMINTTLERIVNLVSPEWREDARIAKDAAAGMVLVTATGASICGLLIFYPYVI